MSSSRRQGGITDAHGSGKGRALQPTALKHIQQRLALLNELAAPHARVDELDVCALSALPCALQRRVIHLWLRRKGLPGIGFHEVEAVRSMINPASGATGVNLPGNRFVRRRKGKLRATE